MNSVLRNVVLAALALVLSLAFVRLGFWQLDRHGEAGADAERRRARILSPPLEVDSGPLPPTGELLWRRVVLRGRLDHEATALLRGRAHQGTPGVHLATPLVRPAGPDVFVVRGWMPAADGIHAPLSRGVPVPTPETVSVRGIVLPGADSAGDLRWTEVDGRRRLVTARLAPDVLGDSLGREIAPFYVRRLTDRAFEDPSAPQRVGWSGRLPSSGEESLPVILGAPEIDAGPHLSYAIQWFSFAAIALVGTAAYLFTRGREA